MFLIFETQNGILNSIVIEKQKILNKTIKQD